MDAWLTIDEIIIAPKHPTPTTPPWAPTPPPTRPPPSTLAPGFRPGRRCADPQGAAPWPRDPCLPRWRLGRWRGNRDPQDISSPAFPQDMPSSRHLFLKTSFPQNIFSSRHLFPCFSSGVPLHRVPQRPASQLHRLPEQSLPGWDHPGGLLQLAVV